MREETDLTISEPVGVDLPQRLEIVIKNNIFISTGREEEVDIWMLELQSL